VGEEDHTGRTTAHHVAVSHTEACVRFHAHRRQLVRFQSALRQPRGAVCTQVHREEAVRGVGCATDSGRGANGAHSLTDVQAFQHTWMWALHHDRVPEMGAQGD
jgi:hypothetical protein